jgi:hypothetical protein
MSPFPLLRVATCQTPTPKALWLDAQLQLMAQDTSSKGTAPQWLSLPHCHLLHARVDDNGTLEPFLWSNDSWND